MKRLAIALAVLAIAAVAGCIAWAWQPAIAPIPRPPRNSFSQERIARGAELAALGDCAVCHTAQGGRPYAGGRGVPTPFGIIYATNITPDPDTGIGTWSEAAFRRTMRDGISRNGTHLYPVLPYPHFTRATDADIAALYAFLMTRTPVRAEAPPNRLPFLLRPRILLAVWNVLFLRPGPWQPDPSHDAQWNRGAYLVEAVGHCGACHSPHNVLGAEQADRRLGGGRAEGWYAPPLQASSPAAAPWTQAALATYLRTGMHPEHSAAAGPMTDVTEQLAQVPQGDIEAIAAYIASLMPKTQSSPPKFAAASPPDDPGRTLFEGACAGCHAPDAPMMRSGAPSLALSTAVNAPTPLGVIQVILNGIPWREGKAAPYMPGFAAAFSDEQIAAIATYIRAAYTDKPAWTDLPNQVGQARQGEG
ncbi:MAG TPA: cytochrome c [Rhodopila sp.]|nr:cytochrome c [Rhodopila sp.]